MPVAFFVDDIKLCEDMSAFNMHFPDANPSSVINFANFLRVDYANNSIEAIPTAELTDSIPYTFTREIDFFTVTGKTRKHVTVYCFHNHETIEIR